MTTPNEDLEWALEKLAPPKYPPNPVGASREQVESMYDDWQDWKDAYEIVKERLKQARLDAEFYREHFNNELPLEDCLCDNCMELREPEERRRLIRELGED